MKNSSAIRSYLLAAVLAAASTAGTALAQVNFNISLAPPAAQIETVPALAPGQTWAPGYWGWNGDRYVWVRGRPIAQRTGYRWDPDRWENRNGSYYRESGRWTRDGDHRSAKVKVKKAKHQAKHDGDGHHRDKGHGKGHGKHGKNKHS